MPKNMILRLGVDASDFSKKMAKAGADAESTGKRIKKSMSADIGSEVSRIMGWGSSSTGVTGAISASNFEAAKNQLSILKSFRDQLADAGFDDEVFGQVSERIKVLDYELNAYQESLRKTAEAEREAAAAADRLGEETQQAAQPVSEVSGRLRETVNSGRRLSIIPGLFQRIRSSAGSTNGGLEKMVRTIRNVSVVSLGLRLARGLFGELGSIVRQYVSENAALQAQVNGLKSAMGQALAPAINVVTNALSALMPYIVGVSNAIGSLIANLFGSGWTTVADGANAAAAAIGGAGGAQKEFNRQLAGFDEITKLNAESGGGGGGGGGGASSTTTAVEAITPAWLSGLSEKIQKFAEEGNYFSIGESLATALNEGIKGVKLEPTSLGTKVGKWVKNALSIGFGFISTFDWYGAAELIADNFSDALAELDPKYAEIKEKLTEYSKVSNNPYVNVDLRPSETNGEKLFKQIQANLDTYSRVSKNPRVNVDLRPSETAAATLFRQAKEKLTEYSKVSNNPHVNVDLRPSETAAATLFRQVKEKLTEYSKVSKNPRVNVDAQANLITHKDSLKNKLVDFIADIKSWRDSRKNKSLDTEANLTTVKDSTKKPTLNTTAIITTYHDGLKDKSISFNANMQTWTNNLKDTQVNLRAQITKDWTGSLADYLGISVIKTKLQVETPKISVSWSESKSPIGGSTIANPKFQVAYNAYGALFNGASLLGLAGGKFQVAGEAGREVLLNVDRHTWWMDLIADKVVARSAGGGVGGEQNITVNLVVDGKVLASTVVRNVNAQARATGRNPLAAYM